MLTTEFSGGLRARPLDARPDRAAGLIFFITDVRGSKDDEIASAKEVCFTGVYASDNAYLSITATAEVIEDSVLASKYWKTSDDVWWPNGPKDHNVRVLRLTPHRAELWDGPASSAVASWEFAKAKLTGEEPALGENRKLTVDM